MKIELIELSLNDGQEILDMIKEIGEGENGFVNSGFGVTLEQLPEYLHRNIESSKGINLNPLYVPQTVYWLMINDKPVGIGKLRSFLNESLKNNGGHIGYCIRPNERGKGYGTTILRELIKKAWMKEIYDILLTCNEKNIPSRRVIEANKGELESINEGHCKYWIRGG